MINHKHIPALQSTTVEDITISGYVPREGVMPGAATSMLLTCHDDGWTCVEEDFIGICEKCEKSYTLPEPVYKLVSV